MSAENSHLAFTTQPMKEEKSFIWKISGFSDLHKVLSPKDEGTFIEFDAGNTIDRPSRWHFELRFSSTNTNDIKAYVNRKKWSDPGKKLSAEFQISFNSDPACPSDFTHLDDLDVVEYVDDQRWSYNLLTLDTFKAEYKHALKDDILTLRIKIVIYGKEVVSTSIGPSYTSETFDRNALEEVTKHYAILLKTGEGSDFVIRVKKLDSDAYVERKVHRLILSVRSPVFKAMLNTQMMEKDTGMVTIEDLSPKGLDVVLEFIYTGNLNNDWKLVPEEIINAAEKYDFPLIKKYVDAWLHTACTTGNAFTLLILADTHGLLEAYSNISLFIKTNHDGILKSVVSKTCVDYPVERSKKKTSKKCLIV